MLDGLLRRKPGMLRGIYLWGGPGRGKTYLMDCFYSSLPFAEKRRLHFHRFMLAVHERLDELPRTPDPLQVLAGQLTREFRVLCLDEFHVTDIADAVILAGLLEALFEQGVVLLTTSNTEPGELYREGLQRELFLPAIDLIEQHMQNLRVDGERDFRFDLLQHEGTYRVEQGEEAECWMENHFRELSAAPIASASSVTVSGRELHVRAVSEDVVWFRFDELCVKPRSTADYLELSREFHTLLLEGIPVFDEGSDEAARRFMHLIDTLYDHGVKLVASAQAEPVKLYPSGRLASGFHRTVSRLHEMSSRDYLERPHRV